jgi:uncharacterized membrane protein
MNTGHTRGRNTLGELCTYLEGIRQSGGFRSLALADTDGLLIAGAGKFSDCEELSALSAERQSGARHVLGRFSVLGSEVRLCAREKATADMVARVQGACERILGASLPRRLSKA